jgi:glycosyltransferase involved in cell wall biosynthesis
MKITYAIGTHNEGEVISSLLNLLIPAAYNEGDEVLIVDDNSTDEQTREIINNFAMVNKTVRLMFHDLNKDFAAHKNFMTDNATGDYIFNIDADEFPSDFLLSNAKGLIANNLAVELFWVPRINIVNGMTEDDINKYGWRLNNRGWINFPDYQGRIYKRCSEIRWKNKVHEVLDGYKQFAMLPEEEAFCLYHDKSIEKQRKQNEFYASNETINKLY